eukprot:180347-Amphidinium_carterae.1
MSSTSFRMLDPAVDKYIISSVVAGGKQLHQESAEGRPVWTYEKDGVLVVATAPYNDDNDFASWFRSSFEVGFRSEASMSDARNAYIELLEQLDSALDGEDRLERLCRAWSAGTCGDITRWWHGVDLGVRPLNRPLVLHCAAQGYVECMKALHAAGFPVDVCGSNKCNIMHLAAWGGHVECVQVLCQAAPDLAQQANKWSEFPELAACNRGCEHERLGETCAEPFFVAAELCLRLRRHSEELDRTWFQEESRQRLLHGFQDHTQRVSIAAGTCPEDVITAANSVTTRWRAHTLKATFIDMRREDVCGALMGACAKGRLLRYLTLEGCGLTRVHAAIIRAYLEGCQIPLCKLDLSSNPLGDGAEELFCLAFFR